MNIKYQSQIRAVTSLLFPLFTISASIADDHQGVTRATWEQNNHRLVVAIMTDDFQSFGMGQKQAEMLAEQTADFGILGMMTTVAAVGINVERETRTVSRKHVAGAASAQPLMPTAAQSECARQQFNGQPRRHHDTFS